MTKKQVKKNLKALILYFDKQASKSLSHENTEYHWRENCENILILERILKYL